MAIRCWPDQRPGPTRIPSKSGRTLKLAWTIADPSTLRQAQDRPFDHPQGRPGRQRADRDGASSRGDPLSSPAADLVSSTIDRQGAVSYPDLSVSDIGIGTQAEVASERNDGEPAE
jgi:hypothetical protein